MPQILEFVDFIFVFVGHFRKKASGECLIKNIGAQVFTGVSGFHSGRG